MIMSISWKITLSMCFVVVFFQILFAHPDYKESENVFFFNGVTVLLTLTSFLISVLITLWGNS